MLIHVLCHTPKIDDSTGFWSNLLIEIVGAILFLIFYEKIYKNAYTYFKNEKYTGRFTHCELDYRPSITNGNEHYSEISINFWSPSILNIVGYDFSTGARRVWHGQIKIDPDTGLHGFGAYKYENEITYGVHDVVVIDDDTLSFQLSFSVFKSSPYLMVKSNSSKIKTTL